MMTTLFFVVAFIVVLLFVYMARYSGRLRVEEKRLIAAPIGQVYAKVADFRTWPEWGPWLEHEPEAGIRLSGVPDGKGGSFGWEGGRIGAATVEHRQLVPRERIEQSVRALHPFRFKGRSYWKFAECDGKTEVTWGLRGRVGFSFRAFAQTVQGVIALDYRFGLDRLARLLEPADGEGAARHYTLAYLGVRDIPLSRYVYRTYEGPLGNIGEALGEGIAELRSALAKTGVQAAGQPMAVYVKTNIKLRTTVCHLGIPVGDGDVGDIRVRTMPPHRAYAVRLTGTHTALEIAWYQAMQRVRLENFQPDQRLPPFERYLNDPESVAEQQRLTELLIPVR